MQRLSLLRAITLITTLAFCAPSFGINFARYKGSLQVPSSNAPHDLQVMDSVKNCGGVSTSVNTDCVTRNLESVVRTSNNSVAASLLRTYAQTQAEGRVNSDPACRVQNHLDTNMAIGRCLFVMNAVAVENNSKEAGWQVYDQCLQANLNALAYSGNLSAQYAAAQFFMQGNNTEFAQTWINTMEQKKGTEEDILMRRCYQ